MTHDKRYSEHSALAEALSLEFEFPGFCAKNFET